jgi:hypothetical protein
MRTAPAMFALLRRVLAIATFILSMGIETVGAPRVFRIDIPGSTYQFVKDISSNRRFVIGSHCRPGDCSNFLWHRGELTTISIPGEEETYLEGINGTGDIVGHTWSPDAPPFNFLRRHSGRMTPITCSFATWIRPYAVNNGRTVVGSSYSPDGMAGGFRWRNGRCEQLPIALYDGHIFPAAISTNGIIVGSATTGEVEPVYGFMIERDEVIIVEHPQALFRNGGVTVLSAVAPNGLVLGSWSPDVGSSIRGNIGWFLYRDGVFESVDVPGPPQELRPLEISSSGVITYADSDTVIRTLRLTSALAQD